MKLDSSFYQLPLRFDVERLKQELFQFTDEDWTSHLPLDQEGKASIILVSVGGTFNDDFAILGAVEPTSFLERCPYFQQVMKALEAPISRCRLIRLAGMAQSPARTDYNYHWFRRTCIYMPIITAPAVKFFSKGESIQMAAGEAWTFDNSQPYWIVNETERDCIHLVIEIKGSLTYASEGSDRLRCCKADRNLGNIPVREVPYLPDNPGQIPLEPYCFEVLTPQEICDLTAEILVDAENAQISQSEFLKLFHNVEEFRSKWEKTFSRFGHHRAGELAYQDLIVLFQEQIARTVKKWSLESGQGKNAIKVISSMLSTSNPPVPSQFSKQLLLARRKLKAQAQVDGDAGFQTPEFEKPIFIVSAPRAGSTLLFETLSQFPGLWTIADESHEIIEGIPELHPSAHNFSSNRLTEVDALPHIGSTLRERFARQLQNRDGRAYLDIPVKERPTKVRFLEKTPKNALRIPFLKTVFPGAIFIYLYRDPRENISSLIEAWRSPQFVGYKQLPGWPFRKWCFLLPPGWSSLQNCSLAEIAAYQWKTANSYILEDLQVLPASSWCLVYYWDLVKDPKKVIQEISEFAGLDWDVHIERVMSQPLPIARRTLSAPSPDKWRKNEREMKSVLPTLDSIVSRVEEIASNS
jgi:hypothetical protein